MQKAIANEQKRRKRSKALFEEIRAIDGYKAIFFSLVKIQQAFDLQQDREDATEAKKANKATKAATKKAEQTANRLAIKQRKL